MIVHETKIRVRYGETDKMNYVYYGNYPLYYEVGRTDLMRNLGMSYKHLEDKGIMLPVHNLEVSYHHPANYDEVLTIKTFIKDIPTARICFYYEIYNEKGLMVNSGKTELVFVDGNTMKPVRPPAFFMDIVKEYFK